MLNKKSNTQQVQNAVKTPDSHTREGEFTSAQDLPQPMTLLSSRKILSLQRTIGNRAVQRLLAPQQTSIPKTILQRSEDSELTEDQVQAAVRYNQTRNFSPEVIVQIQQTVGVNDDGVLGSGTVRAIAAQQGLKVDGKVGSTTLARLVPPENAPAESVPEAAPESEPAAAPPEQGGMLESVIGGLGDAWDSVTEGASDLWDSISGYFGDEAPAATPQEPTENEPAQPPQPSELDQLMLQERLDNDQIRRARELIDQVTDEQARGDLYKALQAKVEYHSQRDNTSTSGGKNIGDVMCNLTSLAMALSYLGIANPDPSKQFEDALEDIRVDKQLPARTTAEGWGGVAKELGVSAEFLGYDLKKDKDWYMATVNPKLREGYAVMMSISGHIVRMQDVTENGLIIDDPYGVVNLRAGEGWDYDKDKKNAREGEDANRGEDSVWAWDAVKVHNMRWIAALK